MISANYLCFFNTLILVFLDKFFNRKPHYTLTGSDLFIKLIAEVFICYANVIGSNTLKDEAGLFFKKPRYRINLNIKDSWYIIVATLIESEFVARKKDFSTFLKRFDSNLVSNIEKLQFKHKINPKQTPIISECIVFLDFINFDFKNIIKNADYQ